MAKRLLPSALARARGAWATGAPPCTRGELLVLAAVVAVGIALRAAWVAYAARSPQTLIDPTFYSLFAEQVADGNGYQLPSGEPTAYYPVGYPAALGAVVWLVRLLPVPYDLPTVVGWFNLVLGVATVVAVFDLARRLLDDNRVGLVAAGLVALWPNLIFHTAVALTETLFNLLLVTALLVLLARPWRDRVPGTARLVAFGVLLGLSALVRPISLLLLPALLVVGARRAGWGWRGSAKRLGVVAVVTALVILPWTVRNIVVLDSPVIISTNVGDNLCIGRHPGASGAFSLTDHCFAGYEHLERPEYELRRNADTTRKALEHVADHPIDELRLLWWRAFYTLQDDHDALAAAESYGADTFIAERWRPVLEWVANLWFFGVLALSVLGVRLIRRSADPRRSAFLWAMVAMAVPPLVFFGDTRFHVPVLPFLAVAGAAAVVATSPVRKAAVGDRASEPG